MKVTPAYDRSRSGGRPALAAFLCLCASMTTYAENMLHWREAWVRSMPPGTQVAAAYGELMNHGDQTVTIVQLTADLGTEAQMHDVIAEGDQRRMVQLETTDIAPGASLVFEPGGRHMMLLGLAEPPAEGSQVEICALSTAGSKACTQATVSRKTPGEHDTHNRLNSQGPHNGDSGHNTGTDHHY